MKSAHRQSNLNFRLMSLEFGIRDILSHPKEILRNEGVGPGMTVLDFGCGPGAFSMAAARLTGPDGLVYAVDIHPLAVEAIRKRTEKLGLGNVRIIPGQAFAEIPSESVDIALMCDVLHDVDSPDTVLLDMHRVIKPGGILSVRDHGLDKNTLLSIISGQGLFLPSGGDGSIARFIKTVSPRPSE